MLDIVYTAEFWILVSFILFMIVAAPKLKGVLLGTLDKRSAQIKEEIDNARRLHDEAKALVAERKRQRDSADQQAQEIVEAGDEEARRLRETAAAELEAAIQRREEVALARIQQAQLAATAEIRSLVVDLAINAGRNVLTDRIQSSDRDPLVEETLKRLPTQLN